MIQKEKAFKCIELYVVMIYLPSILDQAAIFVTSNLEIVTTFKPMSADLTEIFRVYLWIY